MEDAVVTTLNGTEYHIFNSGDTKTARILITFNEKVNTLANFKFNVVGNLVGGGTKSFEFVCTTLGTNTSKNVAECSHTFASGDDSYALAISENLAFELYDRAHNLMSTFDYDASATYSDSTVPDKYININKNNSTGVVDKIIIVDTTIAEPIAPLDPSDSNNVWYDLSGNGHNSSTINKVSSKVWLNKDSYSLNNYWDNALVLDNEEVVSITSLTLGKLSNIFTLNGYTIEITYKGNVSVNGTSLGESSTVTTKNIIRSGVINSITVEANADDTYIYAIRAYNLVLSSAELTHNATLDTARFANQSGMASTSGYITKGMEVWLDGYYHGGYYTNDTTKKETIEIDVTKDTSVSYQDAPLDYDSSKYIWVNVSKNARFTSWSNGTSLSSVRDKSGTTFLDSLTISYPASDGAYELWLYLVDYAKNTAIYKYSNQYIIDTTAPVLESNEMIYSTCNENNKCNSGDTVGFIVSYSEGISGTVSTPVITIGGKAAINMDNLKSEMKGTYIVYLYEILEETDGRGNLGDNGNITLSYSAAASSIKDRLNNTLTREQTNTSNTRESNLTSTYNYARVADTIYPFVTKMELIDSNKKDTNGNYTYHYYKGGDTITIKVTMSEVVDGDRASITLNLAGVNNLGNPQNFTSNECTLDSTRLVFTCTYNVPTNINVREVFVIGISGFETVNDDADNNQGLSNTTNKVATITGLMFTHSDSSKTSASSTQAVPDACININATYNASCTSERVKDKVVVIDNTLPTIEFAAPTTDDDLYSDPSGRITIDDEHLAYYLITIKDNFAMHAKLDLTKIIYNLDDSAFVNMTKVRDTISGVNIKALTTAMNASYKASNGSDSVVLTYNFVSFTHTYDVVASTKCWIDNVSCAEVLKDTLVLKLTISEATGDGIVTMTANTSTVTDKANNTNILVTSESGLLIVDNTIPTPITDISDDRNTWYDISGNENHGQTGYVENEWYSNSYGDRTSSGWMDNGIAIISDGFSVGFDSITDTFTIEILIKYDQAPEGDYAIEFAGMYLSETDFASCGTSLCHITIRRDSANKVTYNVNSSITATSLLASNTNKETSSSSLYDISIYNSASSISFVIYGVRVFDRYLTDREVTNNIRVDASRYATQTYANLVNMDRYVTSGIVSFLDGYYHAPTRMNDADTLTIELDTNTQTSDNTATLNMERSGYKWVNVHSSDYSSVSDETGIILNSFTAFTSHSGFDVTVTLPSENGAYFLFLQLVDKAGNYDVYRYEQAIVIDDVSSSLVDIQAICAKDEIAVDVISGCNYDINTDAFMYRYSAGDTITIISSYNREISSANNGTLVIGSKSISLTPTIKGMNAIYTYTIANGDNGYVSFTVNGITLKQYDFYHNANTTSYDMLNNKYNNYTLLVDTTNASVKDVKVVNDITFTVGTTKYYINRNVDTETVDNVTYSSGNYTLEKHSLSSVNVLDNVVTIGGKIYLVDLYANKVSEVTIDNNAAITVVNE